MRSVNAVITFKVKRLILRLLRVRPRTLKSSLIRGLTQNEQRKLRSRSQWHRKKTRRWL